MSVPGDEVRLGLFLSAQHPAGVPAAGAVREHLEQVELARELDQRAVHCSRREGLIRVSPHFYNSSADIQRLLDCLPAAGGRG